MPEGPEIRRSADQLSRVLAGRPALGVNLFLPGLTPHERSLSGVQIVSVEPRAKAMLIGFANGSTLYSHNQLYGRWYVVAAGKSPRTNRSLRVAIHTRDHSALLYSASDIAVLTQLQLRSHPYLSKLGPDLLHPGSTRETVRKQAETARFQGRRLAALLLDQSFYAGLGNYLRSEILYVSRLHHAQKLGALSVADRIRLADTALAVTHQAYRSRGVTNALERAACLKADGLSFSEYRHHVFAREGLGCWTCGELVRREDVAGRAIFFCPNCQDPGAAPRNIARQIL